MITILLGIFVLLFLVATARAFASEQYRHLVPYLRRRVVQLENELALTGIRDHDKIELLEDKLFVKAGYGHLHETPVQSQVAEPSRRIVTPSEVVTRTRDDVVQMRVPSVPPAVSSGFRKAIRSAAVEARRK